MKYLPIGCQHCGDRMVVQKGRRGYFYRCQSCGTTINKKPTRIDIDSIPIEQKRHDLCRTGS